MKRQINILIVILICSLLIACNNECRVVKEEHENGKERVVEYYTDCNDTTTFKRQTFYDNGQISSEGFLISGVENGMFKSWSKDGILTAEWEVVDGKEHGFIQCWFDNGVKSRELVVEKGILNGFYIDWDREGKKVVEGNYLNGQKEGKWTFWEPNGSWTMETYKNDILWGPIFDYFIDSLNNVTQTLGEYENGLHTGLWKWFTKDSVLIRSAFYKNGLLEGESTIYYTNGNIHYVGQYKEAKRTGICKWYYENGQLEQEALYKDDLRIEVISSYDQNGRKRNAGTLKNGNGTWIKYDDDGKIREINKYRNGVKIE